MRIFLSYASEDRNEIEPVYYGLISAGHEVFFDRKSLPPADDFNSQIKKAIRQSDLVIFFISPASVTHSSYTLTELKFAEEKWKHPKGHILPVMIQKTDYQNIPNYVKAVTVLEPAGNAAAEVTAWVTSFRNKPRRYRVAGSIIVVALIVLIVFIWVNGNNVMHSQGPGISGNPPESNQDERAPSVRIEGKWKAEITYDWGDTYTEYFTFTRDGGEVLGTASFLGKKRGVFDGKLGGDKLSFITKTREVLGDWDKPKEMVHHYRGKVSGDLIEFYMQTEGGYTEHVPVEFTAKKMPE